MSESVRTALESIRERLVGDGSVSRAVDEIDALLLSLRADAWVSVKDRPPDIGVGVLITDGQVVTAAEYWCDTGFQYWSGHGFGGYEWEWDFETNEVTRWRPLPPAPEQKA